MGDFVEFAKRWIALHKGDAIWTIEETPAKYNWFKYLEHDIPEDAPAFPRESSADNPRYLKFATTTLNADSSQEETKPAKTACLNAWGSFVCSAETDLPRSTGTYSDCGSCGRLWCGTFRAKKNA